LLIGRRQWSTNQAIAPQTVPLASGPRRTARTAREWPSLTHRPNGESNDHTITEDDMDKSAMTEAILAAKRTKRFTWARIAEAVALSEVYVTSACLGENVLSAVEAAKVGALLDLPAEVAEALVVMPLKGEGSPTVPKDPLIYRFQEITYVYGRTLKELIEEKFGAGIMSAIDFTLDVEKVADPKGDRVKIVMSGKFLPYKKW
jgi:cyanate lyase